MAPTVSRLELLRDGRGVYGLGFRQDRGAMALIVRPDRFRPHAAPLIVG